MPVSPPLSDRAARARARAAYGKRLRAVPAAGSLGGRRVRAVWDPDPALPAPELLRAVEEAAEAASTEQLKQSRISQVFRARLFGHDAVVKRSDLPGFVKPLLYRFRVSRGKRAWAAGHALLDLGIPTPAPLGYLEAMAPSGAPRSYAIRAFEAGALPLPHWTAKHVPSLPPEARRDLLRQALEHLATTYRAGAYHADAKAGNLLLLPDTAPPRLLWIDLECVRFGVRLTRRRIFRNLVQLNGSLLRTFAGRDRAALLDALARDLPWLRDPRVRRRICRVTARRLHRERLGLDGP